MYELLTQFGIDWKLLLAQVVNFFILLLVLRKFAYGPIIKMFNTRRQKIAEGIEASDQAKLKLSEAKEIEQQILLKAEQEALGIVSAGEQSARTEAEHIITAAHEKSEQVIASGQKKLEAERLTIIDNLEHNSHDLIKLSLEKVLGRIDPTERDTMLIQEALRELKTVTSS